MRRCVGLAVAAGIALSLPAAMSLAVILTVPPLVAWVPPALVAALQPVASMMFRATAALPPDSIPGVLFFGSFALLQGFGANALALHAALLGLPWAAVAFLAARRIARPHRMMSMSSFSASSL
jgi:hypothetical protein